MPRFLLVYLKGLLGLFFFFVLLFTAHRPVLATLLWFDEFDVVDENRWNVLNEASLPIIFSSEAFFRNTTFDRAIFMQNTTPLPEGDISVEIKFRYSGNGFGSGIAVNDNPVALRSIDHPDGLDWTVFVWPTGASTFKVFSPICPTTGTCVTDNVFATINSPTFLSSHVLKIEYIGDKYFLYLDDSFLGETVSTSRLPRYIWLGNPMKTGGVTFAPFYVDYVAVADVTPSPSPSPTPSPTPSPSPTPTPFPYLSQKDPLWKDDLYDSADLWAPFGHQGIQSWGCAITSVAMILQSYHVRALDGSAVNPSKLNSWLMSQPDGYIGPGLLNWLAVTRYARASYLAGHADTKLEFERNYSITPPPALPTILGLPGHFVVAHGSAGTDWQIHDPNNVAATTLPMSTTLASINRFVPSLTDLSYIMLVAEPGTNITLTDPLGQPIVLDWVEEYLDDDGGGSPSPALLTAMIPKPDDGIYKLKVNNTESASATVKTYLYDEQGGVSQDSLTIPPTTTADFAIQYSSTPNFNGPLALDYTSIFEYLKSLRTIKTPANGIFQAIYARFNNLHTDMSTLTNLNRFVSQQSPKFIAPEVKTKLQNYIMLIEQN